MRGRPWARRKPLFWPIQQPGDLVQLDIKRLRSARGVVLKHFSARNMVTRWDVPEVHERATSLAAAHFLDTLVDRMPFPIAALQVDGGSEFAAEFELACQQRSLPLFVLPPRSPKLNGQGERSHRTHHEEFYQVICTTGTSPNSLRSSVAGNTSTTPCVLARRSATSHRSNASSAGNLNKRKPSVTNHVDECIALTK